MTRKKLFQRLSLVFVFAYMASLPLAVQTCEADPKSFSVEVSGEGPPLIFIPGLNSSGAVWKETVERLSKSYQSHVLTLAGFGNLPALEGPFLERVERDLLHYIQETKLDKPVVIGHSLGGVLAFRLGISASSRLGGLVAVDGVPFLPALWNPAATEETSQPQAQQMKAFLASMTKEQMVRQSQLQLRQMTKGEKNLERLLDMVAQADPQTTAQATYEVMASDLRPQIEQITIPTLLIAAGDGANSDAEKKKLAKRYREQIQAIPNHRFAVAEDARHFIMLDSPSFFYETLESFLDSLGTVAESESRTGKVVR